MVRARCHRRKRQLDRQTYKVERALRPIVDPKTAYSDLAVRPLLAVQRPSSLNATAA